VTGRFELSRRDLLRYSGIMGAGGLILGLPGDAGWPAVGPGAMSTFGTRIARREDQLALDVHGVNLRLAKVGDAAPGPIGTARLVRVDVAAPAYLVVRFGPQSIGERAYEELEQDPNGGETLDLTTPTEAILAGGSRLAFRLPPTVTSIPYTLAGLLGWTKFVPSVVPNALGTVPGTPEPSAPDDTQTWIEAPWRVVLSPHDGSGWAHAVDLADTTHRGRTELWHTRLGMATPVGVDEQQTQGRTVRAVWTPGFHKPSVPDKDNLDPTLGKTSLSPRQRYEVVRLTSDYSIVQHTIPYVPRPLEVERLMLSPLGAWLHTSGAWPAPVVPPDITPDTLDTLSWLHHATMGRDHYVRVVSVGAFLPTGHPGALVEVTERKFQEVRKVPFFDPRRNRPAAFLRKRMFLVPTRGWRNFDASVPIPFDGKEMPFKRIRITTAITPSLAPANGFNVVPQTKIPEDPLVPNGPYWGLDAFWPVVPVSGGQFADFRFALEAEDAEQRIIHCSLPLIFVSPTMATDSTRAEKLVNYYNNDAFADPTRRTADLGGQQVALARFTNVRGEAAYPLASFTFGAASPDGGVPIGAPRFFPRMARAQARLDAVERVRGGPLQTPTHTVTIHDAWLSPAANPSRLFAKLKDPVDLKFGGDAAGGVITPHLRITGLSALTGPVGGDLTSAPATFNPSAFFAGAEPEILGGISLLKVIEDAVPFDTSGAAPRLVSTEIPGGIESSLTWRPRLKQDDPTNPVFVPQPGATMVIIAKTVARNDGSPPSTEVSGEITNFHLRAVGPIHLATVRFRRLAFVSKDGRKPDVDADVEGVTFHGILSFVNKLQEFLKSIGVAQNEGNQLTASESSGSGGGGFVEVTPGGIKIGESVALPSIPLAVFLLENVSLNSELNIPFDGQPARMRFSFATREKPFHLTVAMFGGGGFCGVSFGLDNFELFEAALEFGAKASLDIGVASGSVSVMAGIYLAIGENRGELTGYVRLNGELDVLDLVSLNLEFYLGLTYDLTNNEVWGEASLTVEIEVLVFSGSVRLGPIRKRFAGGGSSGTSGLMKITAIEEAPSFEDLVSEVDWQGYCGLFAPAAFG
jgi:hypothetical protein